MLKSPVLAGVLLLALTGCKDAGALEGVLVSRAWLNDVEMARIAVVAGGLGGQAELEVETTDGEYLTEQVRLSGGEAGMAVALSFSVATLGEAEFDLSEAESPLPAEHLFGRYRGGAMAAQIIGGIDHSVVHNRKEVELTLSNVAMGVSMFVGFEWFRIRLADEAAVSEDTGDMGEGAGEDSGG